MSNSPHKKKEKNTFPFPASFSFTLSPFLIFPYVSALNLIPPFFSHSLSAGQCPQQAFSRKQKRAPGSSLVDPLLRHAVFSQWRLNYIFMVTQIRLSCSDTQTCRSAKAPSSTHLPVVCLHSRNCSLKHGAHVCRHVDFVCLCI